MVPEVRGRESSQEDSFWLHKSHARWHLGLFFFVELLDFADHLEAIFLWHLEIE